MKYTSFLIMCYVFFIFLAACSESEPIDVGEALPDIDTVEWNIGNIPATFWPDSSGPTAIINFFVYFKSATLQASDLKSVTITNSLTPDNSWNYVSSELAGRVLSTTDNKKYLSLKNVFSDNVAENGSVIFLGVYTITIELQNGKTASQEVNISAPNGLTAGIYTHVYSPEDFSGKVLATYTALPKRATIDSVNLNSSGNAMIIKFSANDNKIYSGWVMFYDTEGTLLGQTKANFRDFSSGDIHPKLNGGKAFHIDGTLNTLRIGMADIEKASANSTFTVSDVATIHIALSDGKQYEGTSSSYATYSYSTGTVTKP
jgi:hypothetical protein